MRGSRRKVGIDCDEGREPVTMVSRNVPGMSCSFGALLGVALSLALAEWPGACIDITSQSSRVTGEWLELWEDAEGRLRGEAGILQHARTDAGMLFWNAGSAPHGWSWAQGALGPFSLWVNAYSAPYDLPMADGTVGNLPGGGLSVAAESRTRFLVNAPALSFTLQAEAYWNYSAQEQDMTLVLRDLTLDEVLLRWQLVDAPETKISQSYSFQVDPTHEYEMVLSGWVEAWDAKDVWLRLWVGWDAVSKDLRMARIPDVGSSAVLAILGLGGLVALRRIWRSPQMPQQN